MVLVISVWEMTQQTDAATGEYIKTEEKESKKSKNLT